MPSFKIYLSDWNGVIERSVPKTIESDSQFEAIFQYMSEINKSEIATHIVVSGGLSRNSRVFTIREFNESIVRKPFVSKNQKMKTSDVSVPKTNLASESTVNAKIEFEKYDEEMVKLDSNKYIICLFSNGLQFSRHIFIDGESYSESLDRYLEQFKGKHGSFLYKYNIWIKNAFGDNKWCYIKNQFAVEYDKNVRYQRAIKDNNNIHITVYNSKYGEGGEKTLRVVAHDAVDAFQMYVDSHKEEAYPVSLLYHNETKKESRHFDSSDNLIFVRGINSTKDIDKLLFKQFESKDYSTIEYLFGSHSRNEIKSDQQSPAILNKPKTIETNSNKNEPFLISDLFEVFECKNKDGGKNVIWMFLSFPIWILIAKEFGKNNLKHFFDSLIIYLSAIGFIIGLLYLFGVIDKNRFENKLHKISSFVDKYPILYAPFLLISNLLMVPWIMIGCFLIVIFLSALFSGGGRYVD